MRASRALATLGLLAALARPLSANELREDDQKVKRAKFISTEEISNALQKLAQPASTGTIPAGDPFQYKDELDRQVKLMLPLVERLENLKAGYARLPDLAAVDAERGELRGKLNDAVAAFTETFQRFTELRKANQTVQLQEILIGGAREDVPERIAKAMALEHYSDEAKDVRLKAKAVLGDDEEAYQKAAEELRKRRKAERLAAGGAAGVALAGLLFWLWRRRAAGPVLVSGPPTGPSGALPKGTVVGGNFRIEREIGRGGMGLVYEALDLSLQRKVAVKQLRAELRSSPKDFELFLAEARLVASLKHPNVVEIHSIVNEGGELFLVFEFVTGNTLHALLQRVPRLALPAARNLIGQVGLALDYAHGQKVIHRDLKPANVMITPQGMVKVMDFGLAHQAQMTVARETRAESWGTPPYMAPEQELGTVSRESDLYSLGACLYEAVTGKLPFPGPNYLAQKREMRFVLPTQAAPGLPGGLDLVLHRALHADPAQRYHSAAELAAALDALSSGGGPGSAP